VAQPSGGVGGLGPEEFLDLKAILGHAANLRGNEAAQISQIAEIDSLASPSAII
jgi:hypothetical protein